MPGAEGPRDAATRIVRALREKGHVAYLAGGCVRDELLGLRPKDYDVATDALPAQVRKLFRHTNEVGAAFGVMLVRLGKVTVEVATFREEGVYSDKRRPDAVRYADAANDARRRDFTINALFLDPLAEGETEASTRPPFAVRGRVIDFVGGLDDLREGVIRAVGDPDRRLDEDHLRALRAVRFAARLGRSGFRLDQSTAQAVHRHARELAGVSRERIGQELRRMFGDPSRAEAATLMTRLGLDGPVLGLPGVTAPGATAPGVAALAFPTLSALPDSARPARPAFAAALAAWELDRMAGPTGAPAPAGLVERESEQIVRRLREALCLTNLERDDLRSILRGVVALERDWTGLPVAAQKRLAGSAWFACALALVKARSRPAAAAIRRRVRELAASPAGLKPTPFVTGDDLVAAGLAPGPAMGRWLDRIYDLQLEGRVHTKGEAVQVVRGWAENGP